MGCDIHLYVENRVNGAWRAAECFVQDKDDPKSCADVPYEKRLYSGRNYNLFSILADVRNGYGFAGVPTGAGYKPMSKPKGLPADVSPEVKAVSDQWDGDGHSHSWFTVAEIMAYDWTPSIRFWQRSVTSRWERLL